MSALTPVAPTPNHAALRSLVKNLIPSLAWRHHGIGVLQGYVRENAEPEIRVHIWHPALLKSGMRESGDIHDHRFDLTSHVLAGMVGHVEYHDREDPKGRYTTTLLTHARAAAGSKFHGPITPVGDRRSIETNSMTIVEGHTYQYPAGRFHRSPVFGLAVTLVEKHHHRSVPARLLHPIDVEPVMAFGHDMDMGLVSTIVREALKAL